MTLKRMNPFGAPALHALTFSRSPISRLTATIAYYPPAYIAPPMPQVSVLIHAVPPLPPSLGPGIVMRTYTNDKEDDDKPQCKVGIGFAEMARGSEVYRPVEARVALTRDLDFLRRAMAVAGVGSISGCQNWCGLQAEDIWEEFVQGIWGVGGAWRDDHDVYVQLGFELGGWGSVVNEVDKHASTSLLLEAIRASVSGTEWRIKLLRRTMGVNRVVDEVVVKFRHVRRMQWILPDLEATGKEVILGMVLSGGFQAGRVVSLNVYWDTGEARRQVVPTEHDIPAKSTGVFGPT